jgi:hypothetical protein
MIMPTRCVAQAVIDSFNERYSGVTQAQTEHGRESIDHYLITGCWSWIGHGLVHTREVPSIYTTW